MAFSLSLQDRASETGALQRRAPPDAPAERQRTRAFLPARPVSIPVRRGIRRTGLRDPIEGWTARRNARGRRPEGSRCFRLRTGDSRRHTLPRFTTPRETPLSVGRADRNIDLDWGGSETSQLFIRTVWLVVLNHTLQLRFIDRELHRLHSIYCSVQKCQTIFFIPMTPIDSSQEMSCKSHSKES